MIGRASVGEGGKDSDTKESELVGQEGGTADIKVVEDEGNIKKAGVIKLGLGSSVRRRHVGGEMVFPFPL